ncbi:MAG TPA: hypothetical protein VLZ28_03165 [Daejeonella sp.]|nr:hypothetical protein [Daejeonella sp.]
MKNVIFFLGILASGLISACNQPQYNSDKVAADSISAAAMKNQCYQAVFEKDTGDLNIQTDKDGKVTGDLVMKYGLKPNEVERVINKGKVDGSFRGDTLFLNYLYTSGELNKTLYQNPLAFLRTGDQLAMGVGEIETSVGRSYFVKNKPIDFEKGRFKFAPVECK